MKKERDNYIEEEVKKVKILHKSVGYKKCRRYFCVLVAIMVIVSIKKLKTGHELIFKYNLL